MCISLVPSRPTHKREGAFRVGAREGSGVWERDYMCMCVHMHMWGGHNMCKVLYRKAPDYSMGSVLVSKSTSRQFYMAYVSKMFVFTYPGAEYLTVISHIGSLREEREGDKCS